MEIQISSFGSDVQKDSAMYNAIAANAPVWPQWERLSDTMALLPGGSAAPVLSDVNCPGCLKEWVVDVYEKAEHWSFEVRSVAPTAEAAKASVRKDHGRGYVVRGVYRGAF